MRCHICSAPAPAEGVACRACGARLRVATSAVVAPRAPLPTLAPVPVGGAREEARVLLAHIRRAVGAPRIVAGGFIGGAAGAALPMFVLENGALQRWDVAGGLSAPSPAPHYRKGKNGPITCAAFAPTEGFFATGHESGLITWHRLAAGKREVALCPAHRGRVLSLGFAGARLWSAGSDGSVVALEPSATTVGREQIVLDGLAWLVCMTVAPDGAWLALGGDGGELEMRRVSPDGEAKRREWAAELGGARMKSLAFSTNGKMLYGRDATGTVRLWAAQTGHELQSFPSDTDAGGAAPALAPDNRLLALAGAHREVRLFDAWTGAAPPPLALPFEGAHSLAFAPLSEDGGRHTLLLATGANVAAIWKIGLP